MPVYDRELIGSRVVHMKVCINYCKSLLLCGFLVTFSQENLHELLTQVPYDAHES